MTISGATESGGVIAPRGDRKSLHAKFEGVISTGEFSDILSARHALASASQILKDGGRQSRSAPSAREFFASSFFRNVDVWDGQATQSEEQGIAPKGVDSAKLVMIASGEIHSVSDPVSSEQVVAPEALQPQFGGIGANQFSAVSIEPREQGAARNLENSMSADLLGEMACPAQTTPRIPNRLADDFPPEPFVRSVRSPGVRPQPASVVVILQAEGGEISVSTRVAELTSDAEVRLNHLIRNELAAARLIAREIRVNGRDCPADAKE